jgi:hypothetical protein
MMNHDLDLLFLYIRNKVEKINSELFMLKEHKGMPALDGRGLRGGCP